MNKSTIAIRDKDGFTLVSFNTIADALEPEAGDCNWRVVALDGMLREHVDSYYLDDAYADAEASVASPISWGALRALLSKFFQIYDCKLSATAHGACDDLTVCCIDSGQWEVTTDAPSIRERLRRTFTNVISEV